MNLLRGRLSLTGIDFRPATGDLYGVGSDSVVYRLNPRTGIAVAEGPAFTPALRGQWFGVDFNPVPDKIRVVGDARQNLRLNVDEGTVLSADKDLNPGMPRIVGAGYTVDPRTGATRRLGRIGGGRQLVVTGLAAWQDA